MGLIVEKIVKDDLPLVIRSRDELKTLPETFEFLKKHGDTFREQLTKAGGLLFRGFPVSNEHDFSAFIKTLGYGTFLDYIGGDSPRTKISDGIYTSTEAPPSIKIPLHNELSFVNHYPKHVYFYCQVAPEAKGETILADARKIYQAIDPSVRQRFEVKGLKYRSCYYQKSPLFEFINKIQPSHKPWMNVFETDSKEEVEKKCHDCQFGFRWNPHNWLEITQRRPATMRHPVSEENVWFNQAHLFDFNPKLLGWWRYLGAKLVYCRDHMKLHEVFFSDSSKIDRSDLYHILDVMDQNTVYFPWKKGDVLVLDNVLAMHGRATFKGKRRVMVAMTG